MREFIASVAPALGIPDHDAYHFLLAAEEACTNIIQHGVAGSAPQSSPILLDFSRQKAGWTLSVRDYGRPFDPASAPPPDLRAGLRRRRPGGLGVYLIRTLMDEVTYRSEGGENCLRMSRRQV